MPAWLVWLKDVSFITHAYSALLKLQFKRGQTYACGDALCDVRSSPRFAAIDWTMPAAGNVGVLLAELAALRLATYFALRWRLR